MQFGPIYYPLWLLWQQYLSGESIVLDVAVCDATSFLMFERK